MTQILKKFLATAVLLSSVAMMVIPAPAEAVTAAELQAQITALQAQLTALTAQLATLEGGEAAAISGCSVSSFDRNLKQAMSGDDVKCLQIVLNSDSVTQLAASGVGSSGNETSYFGPLTTAAVIKFQEKYASEILASYGLTAGTGFVGVTTRAKLNSILSAGGTLPTGCSCTAWANGSCGAGTCTAAQMNQTRTCTPAACAAETQCVADASCVVAAGLTVTLAAGTPAAAVIPSSATGVEFAKFAFSTDSGTATINSLVVHRYGVGTAAELTNVYLYDGASRLTGGRSVNADTQNVTFSNLSVVVSSTPKILTVKADTAASSTGVHGFEIVSKTAVTTTGTIAISGTFPVKANQMTLSASAAGTATIAFTIVSLSAYLGESAAEVARFRITAGARDITVKGITLTQGGVISNSDLTNFILKRGTEELATADAIDSNDRLVLTFNSDYRIDAGVAKVFSLYADIIGGKTTDNIKFYVEETTDVNILDEVYLVGAGITNAWVLNDQIVSILGSTVTLGDNGPITGSVANNSTSVPISNYSVTVDRNVTVKISTVKIEVKYAAALPNVEAALTDIVTVTGTGQTLASMANSSDHSATIAAGDMVKVVDVAGTYYVIVTSAASADPVTTNGSAAIAITAGATITEVNPYDYIKNVKMVNLDTGGTILGPTSYASTMTKSAVTDTSYSKAYTDSYDLAANTTTRFSIQVDVDNLMASGYSIYATIDYSATNSMKDVDANEYLSATDIVPSTLTGDAQTVTTSSLTVAKTATPVSNSFVVGQSNVPALGIALVAGSAKDISVNKMILRLYADDSAWDDADGTIAANTLVNSVTLVNAVTGTTYGPVNLVLVDVGGGAGYTSGTDYYKATFTNMGLTIPKSTNVAFVAKVNLTGILATSPSYLAVDLVLATGIEAEDNTGSITPVGAAANLNYDASAANIVLATITGAGTLTVTVDAGTPDAGILVTNSIDSTVTKYKLHAVNEAFVVTGLKLKEASGTSGSFDDNFVSVQITYPKNASGDLETKVSGFIGGLSTFAEDSIGIYVPKDDDAYLTIKVTTNSIAAGADSGEAPKIMLANVNSTTGNLTNEFIAVGQASGTKLFGNVGSGIACNNTNVNEMVVRKTEPTVSKASAATTLSNGENILYAFTVGANANENASFRRVVFSSAISDASTANITVGYYTFYRASTPLTTDVTITDQLGNDLTGYVSSAISIATTNVLVTFTGSKEEVVAKGTTNTYYLKATVGVSAVGDSITFRIADDVTNLSTSHVTLATFGVGDAGDTAAWSTTKYVGAYSATLVKTGTAASTYVQFVPVTGTTLVDLDTITANKWSFWHKESATDTLNWAQLELRFVGSGTSTVDVTIMSLQGTAGTTTWTEKTLATTTVSAIWYGTDKAGTSYSHATGGTTIAEVLTAIKADGSCTDTDAELEAMSLTRVRLELWEADARTTYIDDVTVNGVTYAMEPMNFIWSDNSVVSHTVDTSDWTNGYLVEILPTDPLTLSR